MTEKTMFKLCATVFSTCLLASAAVPAAPPDAAPAFANPAFANPDTPGLRDGKPAPDTTNATDIVFVKSLAIGGRAEVELGKLAEQRSSDPDVDAFGGRMAKDHGGSNAKLASLARSARIELPKDLDAEHASARDALSRLEGARFDLAYVEGQIKDHQKAANLLMYEIAQGQHSGLRAYATETLPVVMHHLESARALHAKLTGAAPRGAERP
jgi:putative membrane protein